MGAPLRIGTRGSQLALWQARAVATRLEASGVEADLVVIRTAGDRLQEAPLSEAGGKRLFVRELEDALVGERIDLAVHSAKDMPAILPDGLSLAAALPRDDPRDALVLPVGTGPIHVRAALDGLAAGTVGTSSVRRTAQLAPLVAGARFAPVRGNVDTRLRKLDGGEFDALVLASAGLRRLGLAHRITAALPAVLCVPAPGQGIVAVETRTGDDAVSRVLGAMNDQSAWTALRAEQAVVAALGGGCQLPLGALATLGDRTMELTAVVCAADGSRAIRAQSAGRPDEAVALGARVAADLAARGATALLDEVRAKQGPIEGSY